MVWDVEWDEEVLVVSRSGGLPDIECVVATSMATTVWLGGEEGGGGNVMVGEYFIMIVFFLFKLIIIRDKWEFRAKVPLCPF